jgi:hypothetical protein
MMIGDTMSLPATHPAWLPIAVSVGGTVATMVALTLALDVASTQYTLSSEAEHASGHAVLAMPLLSLIGFALWRWPAPRPRPGAVRARGVIVGGLGIVCAGQLLEAIGAWAFDGDARVRPTLAILHDLGIVVGPLGLLVVGCGITLAMRSPTALGASDLAIGGLALVGVISVFVGLTPVVGVLAILSSIALLVARRRAGGRA